MEVLICILKGCYLKKAINNRIILNKSFHLVLVLVIYLLSISYAGFSQISRTQIMNNATPFTSFVWSASSSNHWNGTSCGGRNVYHAPWIITGSNTSMPYMWGGWSTITEHNTAMAGNKSAGDVCSTSGGGCSGGGAGLSCASGQDCSGFVSRAWGLTTKYSTSTLGSISTSIALTSTQAGDILLDAGSHVRLVETNYGNGNYQVIEASGTDWKCARHTYSTVNLSSYDPRKFNNITSGSVVCGNDDCNGAVILTSNTTCSNTLCSVDNATADYFSVPSCDLYTPSSNILGAGVFFKFTAVSTSHTIKVTPTGTLDAVIVVYSGGCYSLNEIACMDAPGGNGVITTLTVNGLTIGQQYTIRVYDYGAANATSGGFNICVTHSCSPPAAPANLTVQSTLCNSVDLTWNPVSGSGITYEVLKNNTSCSYVFGSSGFTSSSTSGTISTNPNTDYYFVVTASNSCGTSGNSNCVYTKTLSPPLTPGTIYGKTVVCQGKSETYYVNSVTGAKNYTWNLPSTWTGYSNTNSINVTTGGSGSISVTANNDCGSSSLQSLFVNVTPTPSIPGTISGKTSVCPGKSEIYTINPVSDATGYTWVWPSSWTSSGSTVTSLTVQTGNVGGTIYVTANNICGNSNQQSMFVNVDQVPSQPATIYGNASVKQSSVETYSVTPVSGATSYTWSLPTGWTGSSINNTIQVTTSNTNGNICVSADNLCGQSVKTCLGIIITSIVEDVNANVLSVYPNPNLGSFTIKFPYLISTPSQIKVMNVFGQVIYSERINNLIEKEIKLKNFESGIYLLEIQIKDKTYNKTLIIY